jgi:signal transduction histidine kinase
VAISLRWRLALFGAGVVAITLVLFGALVYALIANSVNTNQDKALRDRAHSAVTSLNAAPGLTPQAPVAPDDLRSSTEIFVEVFDPQWSLMYSTAQLGGTPPAVQQRLQVAAPRGAYDTENGLRLYAAPFDRGYVVAGQSTRVPQSNLSGIVAFLVISGIPTLLAALGASWLVAGRALRPLRQVALTADDIGSSRDFGRRLPAQPSRDEVARLAASFNSMLDRLQDSYDSQRRFVADASHELRTPLTTIQGNAGLLAHGPAIAEPVRRAAAADIAEESARMSRLVDRMLTLARADSGLKLELTPLELAPLVTEVVRQASAVHPQTPVDVEAGQATIAADVDAIRQLLWILLDNAFKHARSRIAVRITVEGDWARLSVTDDGHGIAPADRGRVFERFFRADAARTGHGAGLGLSIARWITDQHGGRIIAADGPAGGAGLYVDIPLLRPS